MIISFVEMALKYPIGAKVETEKNSGKYDEIIGYEYYNSTGYLLFREKKINVEELQRYCT